MKQVFVVDDDPGMQDIIELILSRAGYEVTVFPDGLPLMDGVSEPPHLFILDKLLPTIDGTEICRFLKKQETTKTIPVIMLSALPNIERLAKEAGADGFLKKPFTKKDLLFVIKKHI